MAFSFFFTSSGDSLFWILGLGFIVIYIFLDGFIGFLRCREERMDLKWLCTLQSSRSVEKCLFRSQILYNSRLQHTRTMISHSHGKYQFEEQESFDRSQTVAEPDATWGQGDVSPSDDNIGPPRMPILQPRLARSLHLAVYSFSSPQPSTYMYICTPQTSPWQSEPRR